jgi:hypothetical protein
MFDDDEPEFYENNEQIINSSLFSVSTENKGPNRVVNNTSLRTGIVVAAYEIDDELNFNKKFPEYDVLVVEQDKNSTVEPVLYKNCVAIDSFGGVADFFEFKIRPVNNVSEDKEVEVDANFQKQFGNVVLILCLDGSADKGIIIKSLPHPGRKTTLTTENELHLEGEYNGLNWKIDKEGSLTVTFRSKTDNQGKPQDEQSGGTFVKMDKEGSIELNTNLKEKDATSVKLDKTKKDINITAGQNISNVAQKNLSLLAEGDLSGSAKGSLSFVTEGAAKISAKSGLSLDGSSQVDIKGDTTKITGGNMVQIEGGKLMINTPKVFVGQGGQPAIIATTKFIGTGNHGAPVVCNAVGPFSKSVFIAS